LHQAGAAGEAEPARASPPSKRKRRRKPAAGKSGAA
jgi:hypothetical protein